MEIQTAHLQFLHEEVIRIIEEKKNCNAETEKLEGLRQFLSLIIREERYMKKFDEFNNVVLSMAQFDFSGRMDIGEEEDLFTYLATSINLLNEELEANVVPLHFLNSVLESSKESILLIDETGKIQHSSNQLVEVLGYTASELNGRNISNLFVDFSINNLGISDHSKVTVLAKDGEQLEKVLEINKIEGPNQRSNIFLLKIK
ncbi:MAG: PAS domain S-box protein [Cytophagaceae bacterium]